MRPQTLAYTRTISDSTYVSSDVSDILAYVTQQVQKVMGEEVEKFLAEHGPCVLTSVKMEERTGYGDPLVQGRTFRYTQQIMPITGASDDDWATMRRRCNLEP